MPFRLQPEERRGVIYELLKVLYKLILKATITQRIRNLHKEEETIHKKVEEAQNQYTKDASLSSSDFHNSMEQYDKRLGRIIQKMSKLKHHRIEIFSIEKEKKNLEKEEVTMKESAKKLQDLYFNHKKLSRKQFLRKHESIKERMADIEREKALFAGRKKMYDEVKKEKLESIQNILGKKGALAAIQEKLIKKGNLAKLFKGVIRGRREGRK